MGSLGNLANWIEHNVLTVVLLGIGLMVLFRVKGGGDHRGAMTMVGIVLIALFIVGLAVGGGAISVGQWLVNLVTG